MPKMQRLWGVRRMLGVEERRRCCSPMSSELYGANISRSTSSTAVAVLVSIRPSFLTSRDWSTERIWSRMICPFFPLKRQATLVGYGRPLVVIGATITVRMA